MKGCRYIIDTNILLRAIVQDDQKKAKNCLELINEIATSKIKVAVCDLILAEFVWTLMSFYKISKPEVLKYLSSIMSLGGLRIDNRCNALLGLELYNDYNVKFIDAMIASHEILIAQGGAIISYDKDFDKLKIRRLEPGRDIAEDQLLETIK